MLYRVNRDLSTGEKPGDLVSGTRWRAEVSARLEVVGAISPLATPPLAVLPGWKTRARVLQAINIVNAATFYETAQTLNGREVIAQALKVKVETVERYLAEVTDWLAVKPAIRRG
jgi:hypothetical protein